LLAITARHSSDVHFLASASDDALLNDLAFAADECLCADFDAADNRPTLGGAFKAFGDFTKGVGIRVVVLSNETLSFGNLGGKSGLRC
jgi:hypothetical protein